MKSPASQELCDPATRTVLATDGMSQTTRKDYTQRGRFRTCASVLHRDWASLVNALILGDDSVQCKVVSEIRPLAVPQAERTSSHRGDMSVGCKVGYG